MTIYTEVSVSGYNSNPPSDDGSATSSNEISWSKHKTKLGDPLKTALESIDDNVAAAFGKVLLNGTTNLTTQTTLTATHHGKVIRTTNAITLDLTAAATLGDGWNCMIFNEDGSTVTIDPNGAETINGAATISISTQYQFCIITCDGTDFAACYVDLDSYQPLDATLTALAGVTTAANKLIYATGSDAFSTTDISAAGRGLCGISSRQLGDGGLVLSNDTDTDHDINIVAGWCFSSDGSAILELTSEITKQIDATWASGDDAGGLFTGTVANSTTYHVFLIEKDSDGSIDAGFDTSATCANIPTGYTKYRRIGSIYTDGSANIVQFHQAGQYFYLDTVVQDFQVNSTGTSLVSRAMSVPTGVAMGAIVDINQRTTTTYASATYTLIHDAQTTDSAASASLFSLSTTDVNHATWSGIVRTDSANGWIQTRSSYSAAGIYLNGHTKGWFDYFDD